MTRILVESQIHRGAIGKHCILLSDSALVLIFMIGMESLGPKSFMEFCSRRRNQSPLPCHQEVKYLWKLPWSPVLVVKATFLMPLKGSGHPQSELLMGDVIGTRRPSTLTRFATMLSIISLRVLYESVDELK